MAHPLRLLQRVGYRAKRDRLPIADGSTSIRNQLQALEASSPSSFSRNAGSRFPPLKHHRNLARLRQAHQHGTRPPPASPLRLAPAPASSRPASHASQQESPLHVTVTMPSTRRSICAKVQPPQGSASAARRRSFASSSPQATPPVSSSRSSPWHPPPSSGSAPQTFTSFREPILGSQLHRSCVPLNSPRRSPGKSPGPHREAAPRSPARMSPVPQ